MSDHPKASALSASVYWNLLDRRALETCLASAHNRRIVIGVSGGADSMALLLALHSLSQRHDFSLTIAHFNHQTRPGCAIDQRFVEESAARLGIPVEVACAGNEPKPGGVSPEEFWRKQRYHFYEQVVTKTGSSLLALGHTADDLAETFLYHLARGTSSAGVNFQFSQPGPAFTIIRPLWKTPRQQIEQALTTAGQSWQTDASNEDTRYSRNLIRHQVIPALRQINPRVSEAIIKFAELLPDPPQDSGQESLILKELSILGDQQLLEKMASFVRNHSTSRPTRSQLDQVLRIIRRAKTGLVSLHGKTTIVVDQQEIWLYPGDQPTDLDLANFYARNRGLRLAHLDLAMSLLHHQPLTVNGLAGEFSISSQDLAVFTEATHIRNRREGDIISGRSLKKILIDQKIPWFIRDYILFLVDRTDNVLGWIT